jgi:hypothetical protein
MVSEDLLLRLKHPDAAQRRKALDQVARDKDPDNLACLIESLLDPAPAVKRHARKLLKALTGRDYALSKEQWSSWWRENAHLTCQACKRRLYDQKLYYRVKADITCEPREVVITDQDLKEDHQARIQELCEQMRNMPAQEIEEEVWVRLQYFLCVPCKKVYVQQVRKGGRAGSG